VLIACDLLATDPAKQDAALAAADLVALARILLDDCVLTLGALLGALQPHASKGKVRRHCRIGVIIIARL
jgi:hypothetical protein